MSSALESCFGKYYTSPFFATNLNLLAVVKRRRSLWFHVRHRCDERSCQRISNAHSIFCSRRSCQANQKMLERESKAEAIFRRDLFRFRKSWIGFQTKESLCWRRVSREAQAGRSRRLCVKLTLHLFVFQCLKDWENEKLNQYFPKDLLVADPSFHSQSKFCQSSWSSKLQFIDPSGQIFLSKVSEERVQQTARVLGD